MDAPPIIDSATQPLQAPKKRRKEKLRTTPLPQEAVLRNLFITLYRRGPIGRSTKALPPKTVDRLVDQTWSLLPVLIMGSLVSLVSLFAYGQSLWVQAALMHTIGFFLIGSTVSMRVGDVLFNKEEAEILGHRPVEPQAILRAKIYVLVRSSLLTGLMCNLAGFAIAFTAPEVNWFWPIIHIVTTIEGALFAAGIVVLVYQLVLKWFGREKLENLMTTAQIAVTIFFVAGMQIIPRIMIRSGANVGTLKAWWMKLFPPVWFGSLDDAVAGSHSPDSWLVGGIGLAITVVILYLAFYRLAATYQKGAQVISETSKRASKKQHERAAWLKGLSSVPPLSWVLGDGIARAEFLLVSAYLLRDREIKLRVYPAMSSWVALPIIFAFTAHTLGGFVGAMIGVYLIQVPSTVWLSIRGSQHWRAGEAFLIAPLESTRSLLRGAAVAILFVLVLPMTIFYALVAVIAGGLGGLLLLLAAVIFLPVSLFMLALKSEMVPLTNPPVDAKTSGFGPGMSNGFSGCLPAMIAFGVLAVAAFCQYMGYLLPFLVLEIVLVGSVCYLMDQKLATKRMAFYD